MIDIHQKFLSVYNLKPLIKPITTKPQNIICPRTSKLILTYNEYLSIRQNQPTERAKQILCDLLLPTNNPSADMLDLRLLSLQYVFATNNETFIDCSALFMSNFVPNDLFDCVVNCLLYSENSDYFALIRSLSNLLIAVIDAEYETRIEPLHNLINDFVNDKIDVIALLDKIQTLICDA